MSDRYFVEGDDVSTLAFDWGTLKWPVTPETTGSEQFSAGVVEVAPGDGHDLHTHPDSDEMLYFLVGEAEQTVAGDTREVSAGSTVFIPAGVEHGTQNTGWETLKFLAVYAPPGPEAALADDPESTVFPPGEFPPGEE